MAVGFRRANAAAAVALGAAGCWPSSRVVEAEMIWTDTTFLPWGASAHGSEMSGSASDTREIQILSGRISLVKA